jgi:hypothetical protein
MTCHVIWALVVFVVLRPSRPCCQCGSSGGGGGVAAAVMWQLGGGGVVRCGGWRRDVVVWCEPEEVAVRLNLRIW